MCSQERIAAQDKFNLRSGGGFQGPMLILPLTHVTGRKIAVHLLLGLATEEMGYDYHQRAVHGHRRCYLH